MWDAEMAVWALALYVSCPTEGLGEESQSELGEC